jgi:hypothetical protein
VIAVTAADARNDHHFVGGGHMRRTSLKEVWKANEAELRRSDDLAADFIRIELELADTFCKLAVESHSPERARQHRFNARRALDTAFDALSKVKMKEEELEGLVTKIEEVKAVLESLEAGGSTHPSC